MRLNLGCGRNPMKGEEWLNADIRVAPGVQCRIDAEKPLPFKTASVDGVRALGLLEHLWRWEILMTEVARILRSGADFEIKVPYKTDYVAYHVRHFAKDTFNPYRSDYVPIELDFIRRKHVYGSLEFREPYFTLKDMWVEHWVPFSWHVEKYLGINARKLPFGKRVNLCVTLTRNETPWSP